MQHEKGFTLLELMIVVVVVAVLAGIALPSYSDYMLRGKFSEATGNLADLRVKMEQAYGDNRRCNDPVAGVGTCGIPGGNAPNVADGRYFTYVCASSTPNPIGDQQYVLTANGVPAQGLGGISFTVDFRNVKSTTVTAGSDMASKGYAGAGTCWVRKKPSDC